MVQEHRTIILTPEELILAFSAYRMAVPEFLPEGKIIGCKTVEDGAVILSVEMSTDDEATIQADYTFKGTGVLEPLIQFCIESGIILPRGGRKSYSITDGSAALSISLNLDLSAPISPLRANQVAA